MEVGTELSVQIKKAIKAKLQEMQCYVDDELPDYIMVMIANKKTTQQMADDLKIFLSEKSVTFCEWLGEVLERLNKVGDDSASSKIEKDKKSEKTLENVRKARSRSSSAKKKAKGSPKMTRSRSKSPVRVEKRSYKDTKPNNNCSNSSRRAIVDSDSSSAKKRPKKLDEKKQMGKQKSLTPRRKKRRSDSRTRDTGAKSSERKSPEVRQRPVIADKDDSDEVLDKRYFVPEFKKTGTKIVIKNEYNQEEECRKETAALVPDDPLRDASPLSSDENEHLLTKSPETVPEKEKPVLNSAVLTKSHSLKGQPQRVSVRDRTVTGPKKTGIVRPLVVVSNRNQSDLRERLEQRHQRKVSNVPKRMSNRRLDRSLSSLNTIFSKALQEVTTLEISSEKHEEYDPLEPDISETSGRLRMDIMSIPRVTVQNENAEVEILRLAAKKSRRLTGKKRHTSESSNADDRSGSPKREPSASAGESDNERERVILPETSPHRDERSKNTKFVVSLKGASKFLDKLVKPGDISEDGMSNSDRESIKCEKADTHNNDADSNCNISCTNDSPVKSLKLTDYETGVVTTEKNVTEVTDETSRERCKFWPNCKLRDQCSYVHPTKPCTKFPQCPFGDKCLFVHPQCRFAASCTNASCYYSHAKNRTRKRPLTHTPSPYAVSLGSLGSKLFANSNYMPVTPTGDVTCKYGAQCKSSNCPFLHPKFMKDCAFGVSCRRKSTGCKYLHGVGMAKFKWSKSLDTCGKRNAMSTNGTTTTAIETK